MSDGLIVISVLADFEGSLTDVAVMVTELLLDSLGFQGAAWKTFVSPLALLACSMAPQAVQLTVHVTFWLPLPPVTLA
jgi:hypothetical protein